MDEKTIVESSMRRLASMEAISQPEESKPLSPVQAAIARAEQNLDGFELFDYVLGVFEARRKQPPSQSSVKASTSQVENVAHAANFVVVAFESEGIEWCLANWEEAYFVKVHDMAILLGLDDMIDPINQVRAYFTKVKASPELGDQMDYQSDAQKAFRAELQIVETEFSETGGVVRFVTRANEYLKENFVELKTLDPVDA